jgi:hypothetical protein
MDTKWQAWWDNFLNPDALRPRLTAAAIYIAVFESLKDSIVTDLRDLFWRGFDQSGDRIDPRYDSEVLRRNKSPVYASLDWLKEMGAIDDRDIAAFDHIKGCRNTLSHRLLTALADGMPPDFATCFAEMFALIRKIGVWWVRQVGMPEELEDKDIDDSEITPGRQAGLLVLLEIALGDEAGSRYFYEELRRRAELG